MLLNSGIQKWFFFDFDNPRIACGTEHCTECAFDFLVCELNTCLYLNHLEELYVCMLMIRFKFSLLCVMGKVYFSTNLKILLIALPVGLISFCGNITLGS